MTFTPNNKEKTTPEIYKTNKLIAEFMFINNGLDYINPCGDYALYNKDGERVKIRLDEDDLSELEYHSSWNWLMPVVIKCFKVLDTLDAIDFRKTPSGHYGDLSQQLTIIGRDKFNSDIIGNTYKNTLKFIKWYNHRK